MALTFEWDEAKDLSNHKKHGISFDEAKTVSVIRIRSQSQMKRTPMRKTGTSILEFHHGAV
jgi:uncharacterized DUF497 family protein